MPICCNGGKGSKAACDRADALVVRDKTLDRLKETYASAKDLASMKKLVGEVGGLYADDFKKYGIDATTYLLAMANIESSFNPSITNTSGYAGLYQFGGGTASSFTTDNNGSPNRLDPTWSTAAAAQYALDHARALTNAGIEVTPALLYVMHQQGGGGTVALLKNPGMTAVDALMTLPYYQKQGVAVAERAIVGNAGNASMTASQFLDKWTSTFERKSGALK